MGPARRPGGQGRAVEGSECPPADGSERGPRRARRPALLRGDPMSTDDTREALAAMVREGKVAGMYADDHGAAGFCTDHGQADERPSTDALLGAWSGLRYENDGHDHPTAVAEDEETTGPWTCAHCG